MACFYGGEDVVIRKTYELLRGAGLLRGGPLNDQVVLDPSVMGRNAISGAELAVALSALGSFERIHIEQNQATGQFTVARDSREWRLKRLASYAAGNATCDDEWSEWNAAVKAAGGFDELARWIVSRGESR